MKTKCAWRCWGPDKVELRYDDLAWSGDQASKHMELSHPWCTTQSHIKLIFVADSSPWVFKEIKITNLQSYYLGPLWPFCLFLPILFKTCLYNPKISDLSFLKVKHNYLRIIQSYSQASRFIQIGLSSKISKQNKSCCMVHSLLRLI